MMSLWLSAANAQAVLLREMQRQQAMLLDEIHRQQAALLEAALREAARFWSGAWLLPSPPPPRRQRPQLTLVQGSAGRQA
jgi:hypothetical protein